MKKKISFKCALCIKSELQLEMLQHHLILLLDFIASLFWAPVCNACKNYNNKIYNSNHYFSMTYMLCEELYQSRRDEQRTQLKR